MNNFIEKLSTSMEKYLVPVMNKVANNRYLAAIKNALIAAMPLTIVGSFALLIATFPFPQAYVDWCAANTGFTDLLFLVFGLTVSVISVYVAFGIGYNLSKSYKLDQLVCGVVSVFTFLVMVGGPTSENLGATGMFTAIIAGIFSVEVFRICVKYNITIRLPKQVPSNLYASFSALVPVVIISVITVVIVYGLGFDINGILATILTPLITAAGNTVVCALLYAVLATLMWFVGMHPSVLASILTPGWTIMAVANAEAHAAGLTSGYYIFTEPFFFTFVFIGGQCGTLMLNLVMLRSKSKTHRSLAKMALPAGLFNINEPILFGLPIVLNATLIIPALIGQIVCVFTTYIAFASGIVPPMIAPAAAVWNIPAPIAAFLCTNSVKAVLLVLINMALQGLIYLPFYRIVEKQMVEQENAQIENQ